MVHTSFTPEKVIIELWQDAHLSERVCRTHNSTIQLMVKVTVEGQWHVPSISCPIDISFTLKGFILVNFLCRLNDVQYLSFNPCLLKVKVRTDDYKFQPYVS